MKGEERVKKGVQADITEMTGQKGVQKFSVSGGQGGGEIP